MSGEPSANGRPACRYPFFTPALSAASQVVAAGIEIPLGLEQRPRWDPKEEYWGDMTEPSDPILREIVAVGPRDAWELEQVVPGVDWETGYDPIFEAVELAGRAERRGARRLLEALIAEDLRCLDAHAHLGSFAYEYSALVALPHFESGVAVGESSLPRAFGGVLPWGWVDNRPFLRCLHGYGLCLWRLGRLAEAESVFEALVWLNPADNQGVREVVADVRAGLTWEPPDRGRSPDWIARGIGRRALLDRAAATVDRAARTPSRDAIETGFGPLLWLLDQGPDGLPLTQTGALGQGVVREAAARFPGWWDAELFGAPQREAELALLEGLHALARRARLLRRRGRRLLPTRRARAALEDPDALLDAVAPHVIDGDPFEREVAELASAVLVDERRVERAALAAIIHGAVAGNWRTADGPPTQDDVEVALTPFLHAAIGLGALSDRPDWRTLTLAEAGAELLARALRHCATAAD